MSEVFNSNAAVLDTLLCSLMQIIRGAVIAKLLLQFYNATISEMSIVKNDDFSLKIKSSRRKAQWDHNTVFEKYSKCRIRIFQ